MKGNYLSAIVWMRDRLPCRQYNADFVSVFWNEPNNIRSISQATKHDSMPELPDANQAGLILKYYTRAN